MLTCSFSTHSSPSTGCLIVEIKDHRQPIAQEPTSAYANIDLRPAGIDDSLDPKTLAGRIEGGRYGQGPAFRIAAHQKAAEANGQSNAKGVPAKDNNGPEVYRVVLYPSDETTWVDLKNLNDKSSGGTWTEEEALHIESRMLALTASPLCLDPDPHATKVANLIMAATSPASHYASSATQQLFPPPEPVLPPMEKPETDQDRAEQKLLQREAFEKQRREAFMKLMDGGWKTATQQQQQQQQAALAAKNKKPAGKTPVSSASGVTSPAPATTPLPTTMPPIPFVPT